MSGPFDSIIGMTRESVMQKSGSLSDETLHEKQEELEKINL